MYIKDLEIELKKIDPRFEIVPHPTLTDVAGVYFDKHKVTDKDVGTITLGFVMTVPPNEIFEEVNSGYVDAVGHIYATVPEVMTKCQAYKDRYENDPEFKKIVSEAI